MNRNDKEFIVQKIRTQYTEKEHTQLDALKKGLLSGGSCLTLPYALAFLQNARKTQRKQSLPYGHAVVVIGPYGHDAIPLQLTAARFYLGNVFKKGLLAPLVDQGLA